ncbi:MaoC family dehydratase [Halopenitus salinus]|uniref:MaoC family dehydratase n=1 Tax=Halopenitus salinus TaxID=1198295 RepID=A0ABD5UTE4_9EURY
MRYYEDIDVGSKQDLGSYTVPKAEMTDFAERYDPQPIHLDEELAAETIHGGLIASGWYTASVCMRLLVDGFLEDSSAVGAFGVDELRWRTPVRAGDTIDAEHRILDATESTTRDDRGYIEGELTAHNQDGEEVIEWRATSIFLRRP